MIDQHNLFLFLVGILLFAALFAAYELSPIGRWRFRAHIGKDLERKRARMEQIKQGRGDVEQ